MAQLKFGRVAETNVNNAVRDVISLAGTLPNTDP
jgi:hypothetical protein